MRKYYNLSIALALLVLGVSTNVQAQYCGAATTNETIAPDIATQYTTSYSSGYRAFNFTAQAGCTYTFTTCGLSTADTYLRLHANGTGGATLVSADDQCGLQTTLSWTCTTSGVYSIHLSNYVCNPLTSPTQIAYYSSCSASPTPSPTSITASSSTICLGSSTTLTANGASGTVYWFTGGCNTTGQIATGNSITVSPTTTTTYYARNFNGGFWSSICASTTIVVNALPTVNAGPDVSICPTASTTLSGTVPATTTLASVLSAINANQATLTASIPTPYGYVMDGPGGVNSNYISDGGSDMYDGGNYINTNLGTLLNYSDNAVVSNAAFGAGGQYFTRVIGAQGYSTVAPTIFYWAADLNGVSSVSITGNNGADGSGTQDLNTFTVTANGITYNCFLKRVHSAWDPSINQLFMIPQPNSSSQSMGATTDDNLHTISGLTGVTRMYYMLYAGNAGAIISVPQATTIAQTFANIIPTGGTYSWTSTPAGFTSSIQNPTVTPAATTTYTLTTTANGCTNSDNVVVTVNPGPTATLTTASSTVYNGTQVNLGGNVTTTGAWTLTLSNGQTASGSGNGAWSINATPASTTSYSISSITNSTGCPSSLTGTTTITLPTAGSALGNDNESATCLVNQNGWIHFYHSSGRLLASVNSLGQNLGNVTVTSYVDVTNASVPACTNSNPIYNTSVMQRHWVITPTIQPTTPVQVRLPYSNAEFSNLTGVSTINANPNDDVFVPADVKLNKYSGPLNVNSNPLDNCPGTGGSGGTTQHNPVSNGLATAYSTVGSAYYSDFSIPGFSEFWLNGNLSASPLPVELTSFQANCTQEQKVELTWTTASEHNSSHFVIERTVDGEEWSQIATVQSAGNSNSLLSYSIIDQERLAQTVYYRLTQVDVDGASKVYDPVSINCIDLDGRNSIRTYPNPSNSDFQVEINSGQEAENVKLDILDSHGALLKSLNIKLNNGITLINLDVNTFSPGLYYIVIENDQILFEKCKHTIY